jgi:hypothetical protein
MFQNIGLIILMRFGITCMFPALAIVQAGVVMIAMSLFMISPYLLIFS